ncbi:hypothetical protein RHSIM_Rhsim05G0088800 [Rhododendron simsii]|uniref:BRCT domain-containing protein n=1 Tax=Rhododendron simsii TaxID=118357 RepID=A0A834LK36_RHOSS|nr:hypothetical protein RHSIM_Rhsim05G0088800 [Rhododendron simsii]
MHSGYAEIKFTADSKLAEANALMASIEDKSLELKPKCMLVMPSLLSSLSKQTEDWRDWEKKLKEEEEMLDESGDVANSTLKSKEQEISQRLDNVAVKEKATGADATRNSLEVKEKELVVLEKKLDARERHWSYMAVKNQKLQEQFEAEGTSSSNSGSNNRKPIFQGVSIFVGGFIVPSSQVLKGYMLKHGGRFKNYFSRHRVTHIICSNLPDSKIKNLRSFSAELPAVKPAWLLDSVATNKLLSWVPYQLDHVASETRNQPKLSSFFALKSSAVSNDPTTCVTGQVISEIEDPSLIGGTIKESDFTSVIIGEVTCNDGQYSEGNVAEPSNGLTIDVGSVDDPDQASPFGPPASVISDNVNKSTSSAIARPSKRHHSTLVDHNFVENYFKKSRIVSLSRWSSGIFQNYKISLWLCAILTIHEELLKFCLQITLLEVMENKREYLLEMQRHFVLTLLFSLMTFELMRSGFLGMMGSLGYHPGAKKKLYGCGAMPWEFRGEFSCGGKGPVKEFELCDNPAEYVFWDSIHLTEETCEQMAAQMWSGGPCAVKPYNLKLYSSASGPLDQEVHDQSAPFEEAISECVLDKTDVQCIHWWQKVLNPDLVKGPWCKQIKKRSDAEEPVTYMGCGDLQLILHCLHNGLLKSGLLCRVKCDAKFWSFFPPDVKDIRSMGLQVSKLESVDTAEQGAVYLRVRRVKKRSYFHKGTVGCGIIWLMNERNSIRSWLASASASTKEQLEISCPAKESASRGDLDLGVVASLPPDLSSEINDIYDGKLINLISKKKGKSVAQERVQVPLKEGSGTFYSHPAFVNENHVVDKIGLGGGAGGEEAAMEGRVASRDNVAA